MDIDVLIEHAPWKALDLEAVAEAAAMATLREVSLDPNAATVSVLAADDARIATLNADFRGKPTPTNVLSWPSVEQAPRLSLAISRWPMRPARARPETAANRWSTTSPIFSCTD